MIKKNPLIVPTYKMPLIKRVAQNYPYYRALFWVVLALCIIIPTMASYSWDTIWLLYFSPFEVIAIWQLVIAIFSVTFKTKYERFIEISKNNPSHATVNTGPPGSGKSLEARAEVSAMGQGSWEKLSEEYWFILNKKRKNSEQLTDDEKEIVEAYEFNVNSGGIPCVGTNIPMYSEKYRRYAYKIVPEHVKQEKKLPFRMSFWIDEIGTVFDPKLHLDSGNLAKSKEIGDFCRFDRQFGEYRFIGTEQEASNIYKDIRRVVGLQRLFVETKVVLKPKILSWIYKKLMNHFTKKMSVKQSKYFSSFMRLYKKFLANCGFFRLKYRLISNTETGATIDVTGSTRNKTIYLPCAFDSIYETRAFRSSYACKNENIDIEVWKDLKMLKSDAVKFLRATNFYERQKQKEEREGKQKK